MTPTQILAALRRAVHAACRAHGLDDDTRRDMLQRIAGVRSTTQLTLAGCNAVLNHLNQPGTGGNEWAWVFTAPADRQPHLKKIYRLAEWVGQRQDPPVPVASVAYIEGIARQMAGLNKPGVGNVAISLRTCDAERLHQIVQALETYKRRRG